MKIREIHEYLEASLSRSVGTAPQGTVLGDLAGKIRLMAHSYESDGLTFLASGDVVNALAAFWYALGWLHFGYAYGLITRSHSLRCPAPGSSERFPQACVNGLLLLRDDCLLLGIGLLQLTNALLTGCQLIGKR